MERLIFVDSNIWCYYFDRSAKEHEAVTLITATMNPRNHAPSSPTGARALG